MSSIYLAGSGQTVANVSVDYPRPERLVSGNPKRLTYDLYQHPAMNCGIWECEVGSWNIQFSPNKQEFFSVIHGKVRIHDAQSEQFIEIAAGEAGIIPPNFQGRFEVIEQVKKYFVIVDVS
ncbi:cupin domain-containing protein [uncultured Acinetobacter sp.]|uniref:cupin domain-containing protein n=1 Tax=uncultured Acinetobacter sp. TaxID=165433 RepID=UPI00258D9C81|nr:cupin domain-containing protein [uncultured Acinetobacter sp.]